MKRLLNSRIISLLGGRPIRLSSPDAEGQLLSITAKGEISLEDPGVSGFDQYWKLVPMHDGFQIVSSEKGYRVCHHPANGGVVTAIKEGSSGGEGCVWKLGNEGEIFQENPLGGERYLWLAGSHLYVTQDGFLAERWAPFFQGEKLPSPVGPQHYRFMMLALLGLIILYFSIKS